MNQKKLKDLNLMDDFLFQAVMTYPDIGELFAQRILELIFHRQFQNLTIVAQKVYGGMVIGQTGKTEDIEINVCRSKKLTNTRASGSDDALKLSPPKILSLEQALEFIDTDELLEITPENIRIRKKILDPTMRKRAKFS